MAKTLKYYNNKQIILASASPRRNELLKSLGLSFEVLPADIDEDKIIENSPDELVKTLAFEKAKAINCGENFGKTIISGDTIVFMDKVYGKPNSIENAFLMLRELSGKWHKVFTGVTVCCENDYQTFVVCSKVFIKNLSDKQIERYIKDKNPLDKAGSYGIQDEQVVEKYEGNYSNIVGLPVEELKKILQKVGVLDGNN